MKGINRPNFPTRSDDPDTQRLLAAVNEVVTAMLNSGVLLSRVAPGSVIRPGSSPTGTPKSATLAWDTQNRVDVGVGTGIVFLPAIRPELIGRPLYMTKVSPSGTVQVKPSGAGVSLNGFSGVSKQAAGLTVFMVDGQNWAGT